MLTFLTEISTFLATHVGLKNQPHIPGDYDGDGKTNIAVYRVSTGAWYIISPHRGHSGFKGVKISQTSGIVTQQF